LGELKIKLESADKIQIVKMDGDIDENAKFPPVDTEGIKQFILDLKQVSTINSAGIREWIRWIEKIPTQIEIAFRHCPRPIVDQINILKGFLPNNAEVESFYVPFYCERCGKRENKLYHRGIDFTKGSVDSPPKIKLEPPEDCEEKECPIELDVLEPKYFGFLKYRR